MNTLLKLDFYKSLGFPTKESGVEFIKQNQKLKKKIEEKVDEMEEVKYQIIEDIRDNVFNKYEDKKDVFLIQVKGNRNEKIAHKKQLQKIALKEEMRAELLKEIKDEESNEQLEKFQKKYSKAVPVIESLDLKNIEHLFINVLKKIDNDSLDEDDLKIVEKMKIQTEKAIEMLLKVTYTLNKLNN